MKIVKLVTSGALLLTVLVSASPIAAIDVNLAAADKGLTYLRSQQQLDGSIAGFGGTSQWATIAFASRNVNVGLVKVKHGESLLKFVRSNPPTASDPATAWERAMLAVYAAGHDPKSYQGVQYLTALQAKYNGGQLGDPSLLNDDIFGLLALVISGKKANMTIKQNVLSFVLSHQAVDGGFSWSVTGSSDSNDTAAAIQALQLAKTSGLGSVSTMTTAINNAKTYLLSTQNADGGFGYDLPSDSDTASSAWAVLALASVGSSSTTASTTAKTFIRNHQISDGSFEWMSGFGGDTFTTSYAVAALSGKFWPIK